MSVRLIHAMQTVMEDGVVILPPGGARARWPEGGRLRTTEGSASVPYALILAQAFFVRQPAHVRIRTWERRRRAHAGPRRDSGELGYIDVACARLDGDPEFRQEGVPIPSTRRVSPARAIAPISAVAVYVPPVQARDEGPCPVPH